MAPYKGFEVWDKDNGEEEYADYIEAADYEHAAEIWAHDNDENGHLAEGATIDICIKGDEGVKSFSVTGVVNITYSAREISTETK